MAESILKPKIHESAFIADGAKIYGDVEILEGASVWFNAVIRGDEGKVIIGRYSNIQDNCVIHSDDDVPVTIGENVVVGHGAVVRGCSIGSNSMIGMNSTVMNRVVIGASSIVGTAAMVPNNKSFPPNSLILGIPAKLVRKTEESDLEVTGKARQIYADLIDKYRKKEIVGY